MKKHDFKRINFFNEDWDFSRSRKLFERPYGIFSGVGYPSQLLMNTRRTDPEKMKSAFASFKHRRASIDPPHRANLIGLCLCRLTVKVFINVNALVSTIIKCVLNIVNYISDIRYIFNFGCQTNLS